MTARAIMPGSALACLDALAGDAVENSCEKALFATPEATASAVSYVAAQLSLLLAAGNERARRGDQSTLANLRRSVELDRFGIVAHVLAVRDGCTPAQCDGFALMHDASRVSLNMAGHTYDAIINRHMARWPSVDRPVAGNAPPAVAEAPTGAPVAGAKLPDNLFLPSSSSIPAVSIMNTEPSSPPETTTSGETTRPTPRRKPPQAQARAPAKNPSAVPQHRCSLRRVTSSRTPEDKTCRALAGRAACAIIADPADINKIPIDGAPSHQALRRL